MSRIPGPIRRISSNIPLQVKPIVGLSSARSLILNVFTDTSTLLTRFLLSIFTVSPSSSATSCLTACSGVFGFSLASLIGLLFLGQFIVFLRLRLLYRLCFRLLLRLIRGIPVQRLRQSAQPRQQP